jgi:hypothetical protein
MIGYFKELECCRIETVLLEAKPIPEYHTGGRRHSLGISRG